MLRKRDNVSFEELKKYNFKYGTRDRFIYKTKSKSGGASIYIDLLPCNNNNNKINIECESYTINEKIVDKLYDLIQANLVEKVM